MSHDQIYALPLNKVGSFEFDERVVEVFPDMIARSVPGYGSVLSMTAELAARYAQPNTRLYDLGCSLGASTLVARPRIPADCTIHAIDSSPAMVARLSESLRASADESAPKPGAKSAAGMPAKNPASAHPAGQSPPGAVAEVCVQQADIRQITVQQASFAILNFTLQFVPLSDRLALLAGIARGTLPGGALVVSEKVHFDDPHQQQLMTALHHDFKRAHGYSDLEIAQKRTALENTLVTQTVAEHEAQLREAGFQQVGVWFQCFNFVSMLAVKAAP